MFCWPCDISFFYGKFSQSPATYTTPYKIVVGKNSELKRILFCSPVHELRSQRSRQLLFPNQQIKKLQSKG